MGVEAYNRGTLALVAQIDRDVAGSGVYARNERRAAADERKALLARIADLELRLRKSERARKLLRAALSVERQARIEERERADREYRFAVRILAKRAGLEGA